MAGAFPDVSQHAISSVLSPHDHQLPLFSMGPAKEPSTQNQRHETLQHPINIRLRLSVSQSLDESLSGRSNPGLARGEEGHSYNAGLKSVKTMVNQ